jgi:hypothetical protein
LKDFPVPTTPVISTPQSQVNTTDGNQNQFRGRVVGLQDGGYVVVWEDQSHVYNPAGDAIIGQRYNAAGAKVGGEFNISQFTVGFQADPALTVLNDGSLAVAFVDSLNGQLNLYVRIFDPSMNLIRTDPIDTSATQAFEPSLTALADGGYVVSYTVAAAGNNLDWDIVARFVAADGQLGAQFDIDNNSDKREFSELATLSNGNFVVVYQDQFNGSPQDQDVKFKILTPAGGTVTGIADVPGAGDRVTERAPDVAALKGGGFVVVWTDAQDIHATILTNSGGSAGAGTSDFLVNTSTGSPQDRATVVGLADGGFVVTWEHFTDLLLAQRFDEHGVRVGVEFRVLVTFEPGYSPDSALLADGRFAYAINEYTTANDLDFEVMTSIWSPFSHSFQSAGNWSGAGAGSNGKWYVGDFSGDGRDDIFRDLVGTGLDVFKSTGASFVRDTVWSPAGSGSNGLWYVGDFNGDGKDDVFRDLVGTGLDVFRSTGTSFVHDTVWTPAGTGSNGQWYVGDFNGDGKDDIMRHLDGTGVSVFTSTGASFANGGIWSPAGIGSDNRWYVGDFNGDGKDDLLRTITGTSAADVFLSDGARFIFSGSWLTPKVGAVGEWEVGDFNGDGRADIFRTNSTGADMFLSDGKQFVEDFSWTPAGPGSDGGWYTGDYNGDHIIDIFRHIASSSNDVFLSV